MVHSNREQFVINERLNSTKHYHRQLQWEYLLGIGSMYDTDIENLPL